MPRSVLALATVLSLAAASPADDPKKSDPPVQGSPADSPLKAAFDKYQKALADKVAEARKASPQFQKELFSEIREYQVIELDKLYELAVKEPTTPVAFDVFAELMFGGLDKEKVKSAGDLVVKHHVDQPHVKKILLDIPYTGNDRATELLEAVVAKNVHTECQGLASFSLGVLAKMKAKEAKGADKDGYRTTAEKHFATAKEKYGDVKANGQSLAKLADAQLLGLKMMDQLQIGKPVPDIAGEDLDGKPFKLSDYKGKVTVLSFWATWCPPCMALVPHEIALVESMKDKPFALIGVNGDELDDTVRKRIADKKITWRSFKNEQPGKPALSDLWDIEGWPTIYVIDHTGVIRHVWTGSPGEKVMDEAIEKLVNDAEKK